MKTRLLFILIVTSFFSFSQDSLLTDLAKRNIQLFNDTITQILEQLEAKGIDFIATRSNVKHGTSCYFMVKRDSCTREYYMFMGEDGSIRHGYVSRRSPINNRSNDDSIDEAYYNLTLADDYFNKDKPNFAEYDSTKIICFGFVNGRYLHEIVARDYFFTHHPGIFYHIFKSRY